MQTQRDTVDHVQMQRGGLIGEFEQLTGTRVRRRAFKEIREGDHRHHSAATPRARGCRRGLEVIGERHQTHGLDRIELYGSAVVVHDGQVGHRRKLPPSRRPSTVRRCAV